MKAHTRGSLAISVFGLCTSLAGLASAQQPVGADVTPGSPVSIFGSRGQIAISSEAGAALTRTSVSGVDGSTTTFVFRPGVDYFLMDRLSLGAFFGVDYESLPSGSSTTIGVGPRVGYSIPFSDRFSIWPKAGFSFNSTSIKVDATTVGGVEVPESDTSNSAIALNLFAPIMFHAHHYFAGIGPALDTDLSGDAKATTFAVRVTLGGWLF
jgi:hypothetical protein